MALIALAADKGSPGVSTAAIALGAVWPRPVLVAEVDPAGGDLVYRLPAEGGEMLDPGRGLLSLATTARRGLRPEQIGQHVQRLSGGLDVLVGLTNAEQAQGLTWLWSPLGRCFASLTPIDVIADCGRLSPGTPMTDLLREADLIVLLVRPVLDQVAHLRERISALAAVESRTRPPIGVVVIADPRGYRGSIDEIERIVTQAELPATILGGFAYDPKGAEMLRGHWGGRLDKSLLVRSARELAGTLMARLGGAAPASRPAPMVTAAPHTGPIVPPSGPSGPASSPTDLRPPSAPSAAIAARPADAPSTPPNGTAAAWPASGDVRPDGPSNGAATRGGEPADEVAIDAPSDGVSPRALPAGASAPRPASGRPDPSSQGFPLAGAPVAPRLERPGDGGR